MYKRNTLIIFLILMSTVLLGSDLLNIKTAKAETETFSSSAFYTGVIKPFREANLGAVNAGRIEKIYFEEGSNVKKDDIVARLSDENLTRSKIDYLTKQKDFNRTERLFKKGSVPEQTFDHVKAIYDASEEQYLMYEKNTEIKAPFSGIITAHLMNEGETFLMINPGILSGYSHSNGIVRLIDISKVYAVLQVGENELANISKGQNVVIKTRMYDNIEFFGKIERISEMLDMNTHTAEVKVLIDNPGQKLKPGLSCNVEVKLKERSDLLIPREALVKNSLTDKVYVFVTDGKIAKKKPVEIILQKNDKVAVTGLNEGDVIVTGGKNKLSDGSAINIIK